MVIRLLKELRENFKKEIASRASGQDGGIGRYTVPPLTTKRRTTRFKNKKQPELTEN